MNPLIREVYPDDDPFSIPFPSDMLKVAQDQHRNNEDAQYYLLAPPGRWISLRVQKKGQSVRAMRLNRSYADHQV